MIPDFLVLLSPEREGQLGYRRRGKGRPGAIKRRSIAQQLDRPRQTRHLQRSSPPDGCPPAGTWPQITNLAVRGCLSSKLDLSCSSHITWERVWVRFFPRGVYLRQKLSEVGFLYGVSAAPPVPHQNHKPVFAEISDLAKNQKLAIE